MRIKTDWLAFLEKIRFVYPHFIGWKPKRLKFEFQTGNSCELNSEHTNNLCTVQCTVSYDSDKWEKTWITVRLTFERVKSILFEIFFFIPSIIAFQVHVTQIHTYAIPWKCPIQNTSIKFYKCSQLTLKLVTDDVTKVFGKLAFFPLFRLHMGNYLIWLP